MERVRAKHDVGGPILSMDDKASGVDIMRTKRSLRWWMGWTRP